MPSGNYTLLVDETGIDGRSQRVMYVGCLFETSELANIKHAIDAFNQNCLDDPFYSAKPGLVNSPQEARHFVEDNESLRVKFINDVIRVLPCRVYAVFDKPKATIRQSKTELFKKFINYVRQVREIKTLSVIIEKSGPDDKYLEECGAQFRDKSYSPLSIADYYGAILHRFHEKRLLDIQSGKSLKPRDMNGLAYNHYSILVDRISLERDLSTGEKSSRREGRYFLDQIKDIIRID